MLCWRLKTSIWSSKTQSSPHCKKSLIRLQIKGDLTGVPIMLVGNKCDEETNKREVNRKTGEALQVKDLFLCNRIV